MRTITMQEAEEQARAARSEAWLTVGALLIDAEAQNRQSTIVDSISVPEQSAAPAEAA